MISMLKITLLSISLLTVFGTAAVAPALAEIAAAFPQHSATEIKSLLTAPALMILFASPLTHWASMKIGQKPLLIFGLSCYCLAGLACSLATSFYALFAMRLVFGIGIGILMPMGSALIAQSYSGRERLQLIGWSSSASNLFSILASVLVGFLALLNWRFGFFIYGIAIFVLVLVIYYIPRESTVTSVSSVHSKLPIGVYIWSLAIFLHITTIYSVPTNIALFITENNLGGSREAGIAVASMAVPGFFSGLIGVQVKSLLGRYFSFSVLLLGAMGYMLLSSANTLSSMFIALLLIGIGSGFLMPYLFFCITNAVKNGSTVAAMSVLASAAALGQLATPLLLDGVSHALGDSSTNAIFQLVAMATAVFCAANLVMVLSKKSTLSDNV